MAKRVKLADVRVAKIDPGGCRLDPWRFVTEDGEEIGYWAPYPGTAPSIPVVVRNTPVMLSYAFPSRKAAEAKLRELQEMHRPHRYEQPALELGAEHG